MTLKCEPASLLQSNVKTNLFLPYLSQDSCNPNPCENGGTCKRNDDDSGYKCQCKGGFSGTNCEDGKTAYSIFKNRLCI